MKKIKTYLSISLLILFITACSKDDNNDQVTEAWKQQNEQAFNNLAKDPSFTELKSLGNNGSIYYRVIKKGNGKRIFYNSRAEVYYKGCFVADYPEFKIKKGDIFDQKLFDDGAPLKVAMRSDGAVNSDGKASGYVTTILGWNVALQHMVEGDKWEVWIPHRFGYGENGKEKIPGYTTLAFEIEVVKAIDPNEF